MNWKPKEPTSKKLLLIIPCYNEAGNIRTLLEEIQRLKTKYETVVIDDGSKDNTYAVASQFCPCLRLKVNLGIGGAVQTGIQYALEKGYDLCARIDGDGQHPPDQLAILIKSYLESPANLIIGSRFFGGNGFQSTWTRRLGIGVIRCVFQWLYGHRITDPTSGFMLMDREAIQLFSKEFPQDYPESIATAIALERGLTVREVPVKMRPRVHGSSSISRIESLFYMLRVVGYLILIRMGRHL